MILIVGVGNRLMGDDGFGSCLAEVLKAHVVGADVIDLGIGSLWSVSEIEKYDKIIILDIANIEEEYGVYEIKNVSESFSSHDLGLSIVKSLLPNVKFYLIACKPEVIELDQPLSRKCMKRIERLLPVMESFLLRFNVEVKERDKIIGEIKEKCSKVI